MFQTMTKQSNSLYHIIMSVVLCLKSHENIKHNNYTINQPFLHYY